MTHILHIDASPREDRSNSRMFIHANGLDLGDEARRRGLDEAISKIKELINDC